MKGVPTNHFPFVPQTISHLWVLLSKRAGIPKGWRFLWPGVSNRGESALLAENSKGDTLPWQEESNETGGFVAHDFVRKVVCVIPLATVGGGKGLFWAGTSTFRQPQNRRVLRPPGREAQEFAIAESACSGIGGAAERREFRKKFLERSSITGGAKGRR